MRVATGRCAMEGKRHYLETELFERFQQDVGLLRFLVAGSLDGVWYWDLEHPEHEWMNTRFWELLGYDPNTKPHSPEAWQDIIHPDDLKTAIANFHAHCANPDHPYDQVVRYRHASGSTVWVRCRGVAIRDEYGSPVRMLGAHNDITELKETEEKLRQEAEKLRQLKEELKAQALQDELTGLYNRRAMREHFLWAVRNAKRRDESLSVLLLDIDHFKQINDQHGHDIGDRMLTQVSKVIADEARESDLVARIGGEEFVVLLHSVDSHKSLHIANRIRKAVEALNEHGIRPTVSVGVATVEAKELGTEEEEADYKSLMRKADLALYRAKHEGRNRACHDQVETLSGVIL